PAGVGAKTNTQSLLARPSCSARTPPRSSIARSTAAGSRSATKMVGFPALQRKLGEHVDDPVRVARGAGHVPRLLRVGEEHFEIVAGERLGDGAVGFDHGLRERIFPFGQRPDFFLDGTD